MYLSSADTQILPNPFANKALVEALQSRLPEAEYLILSETYPNFQIDTPAEQARVAAADVIVFLFPIHWYSVPPLMKLWQDEIFVHGFALGSDGDKVKGKKFIMAFTTGSSEADFQEGQLQSHPVEEYLLPFKQFAKRCQMEWGGFEHFGGMLRFGSETAEQNAAKHAKLMAQLDQLIARIQSA